MIRNSKDLLVQEHRPAVFPCRVQWHYHHSNLFQQPSVRSAPARGTPTITSKYHTVPLFSSNDSSINTIVLVATSSFKRVNRVNPTFYQFQSAGTVLRKQLSSVFLDTEDGITKILDSTCQSLESRSAAQDTASARGFGCEARFDVGNERGYS